MAYEKRMCVMKQLKKGFSADGGGLSGVVYAEKMGDELTVTPRLIGLSPLSEGRYVLVVRARECVALLPLSGNTCLRANFSASLRDGFSALLCFVRGEAEGIAYGACGTAFPPEELLKAISSSQREEEDREEDLPFRAEYDDEAIASDNYFFSECDDARGGTGGNGEEEKKETGGGDPSSDDVDAYPRGTLAYYKEVRDRLDEARKKFPADDRLKKVFPQSEWFRSDGALLGIIYENGLPKYLCVAVEKTSDTPPPDMGEGCCFVPLSLADDQDGFFITFQDADTGALVKVYDR